jgi:hypothetical protein
MLLCAVQATITKYFLNTMSPRSCKILRRFLVIQDVPVDVRLAYPHYRAILDLLRMNPTLTDPGPGREAVTAEAASSGQVSADASRGTGPEHSAEPVGSQKMDSEDTSWNKRPAQEVSAAVAFAPVTEVAREVTSWTPHAKSTLGATAFGLVGRNMGAVHDICPATIQYEKNFTRGPSRGVVDLAKAYSSDRKKFSGEDPEQSLRLIRRSFLSTCDLMHVSPPQALRAAHLPFMASALDYYYEAMEGKAANAAQVFDMIQDRFQTRIVQDRALSQWLRLDVSSQQLE